jgi:hypothetical protein
LLQGKRPAEAQYSSLDFDRLVAEWPQLVAGAGRAVELLEAERVPDGERLPTGAVLAPLIALLARAPDKPDAIGALRTILRMYVWRAFVTDRYESAAATAAFQDYQILNPLVAGGVTDAPTGGIFDLDLPVPEELLTAGWPKNRARLARAILCVSFRRGALDIADGRPISFENIQGREYHHLFPVSFLRKQGVDEESASRALNCALITWLTNRVISDKPPVDYLRERIDRAALGEDEIRSRVATHAIDFEDLASGDFERFMVNRAALMAEAFTALSGGAEQPV